MNRCRLLAATLRAICLDDDFIEAGLQAASGVEVRGGMVDALEENEGEDGATAPVFTEPAYWE